MGAILSFVREHRNIILASLSVASIIGGGAAYLKYKKVPRDDPWRTPYPHKLSYTDDDLEMGRTLYTTMTKTNKIDSIVNAIRVNYVANSSNSCLEPHTIVDILQHTTEIAAEEYASATIKNRTLRRQAKEKGKTNVYLGYILKYNEEMEEILEKAQAELLLRLDIPKDVFEESMLMLMDRGYFQELYTLQASVKQKIKQRIPSNKDLSSKQIKEIIRYQIRVLRERPESCKQYMQKLQANPKNNELIPLALNLIIQDFIYQQFGIEEEDQIRCLQKAQSMGDIEIHQLLGEIEHAMTEFMNAYGLGGIEQVPDSLDAFI